MRIALIPSSYAPFTGGVEELTRNLALELVHLGHGVEVWTSLPGGSELDHESLIDGIVVRRFSFELPAFSPRPLAKFPVGATKALSSLHRAVRSFRPDILHVQCFGPNGAYATLISQVESIPLIVTLQGETQMDDHDVFEHSTSLRIALRRGLRRAGAVTACSDFTLKDARRRFGLPVTSGRVIFNAVPLVEERAENQEPRTLPFDRYVLGMGRVVHKKGFDLLLGAFARIAKVHGDVGLVIAGDGDARVDLEKLAEELDVTNQVHFPGRLDRSAVKAAMNGAEIFVMPSRLEPFGIVVLEAWRSGTAVIATSRGGAPEFVRNEKDGMLVDPFEKDELTKTLDELLSNSDRRQELAEAGRRRVTEFSWEKITRQYEELYESLAKTRLNSPTV